MDPLSITAGAIAIFEALKEAYRFGEDVIKAPVEREEFNRRLSSVANIKQILSDCLAQEPDPSSSYLVQTLDVKKNPNSPLKGLLDVMTKMLETLKTKETTVRKWKDFKWHSEKKSLEGFFVAIDGCCTRIVLVLSTANIEISRLSRENNSLLKKMNSKQDVQIETQNLLREETDRKAVERWLSPLDFQARQREIFEGKAQTGEWFFELEAFQVWKRGELDVLRCHGTAGTGKTVLSSIVAERLANEGSLNPILCLYIENSHTSNQLLGSLVKQLVQLKSSGIRPEVRDAWKKQTRVDARPSEAVLKKLLAAEADEHDWVYVIADGLDEASEDSRYFIEQKLRHVSPKLRLLTMARLDEVPPPERVWCSKCKERTGEEILIPVYYRCKDCPKKTLPRFDLCPACKTKGEVCIRDPDHEVLLPPFIEVQMIVPDTDLKIYIETMIKAQFPTEDSDPNMESATRTSTPLGRFCADDEDFFNDMVAAVLGNSYGKFLLAKVYLKSISNKSTKKEVRGAGKKLQAAIYEISDRIDVLYDKDLDARINKQDQDKVIRAKKLMSIIYYARRTLTLDELKQIWSAETVEPDEETVYDEEGMIEEQDILNCTGGFITVGREDEIVRFDDRTLREYFDKKKDIWFPEGETYIATLCLRYLGFDIFSKRCPDEKLAARDQDHPFFAYAVQYWGDHVRGAGRSVEGAAVKYLDDASRMDAYIQGAWETNTHDSDKWDVRRNIHVLHVCAWFNLAEIISELDFATLEDVDIQETTYGQTPLMYACRRGNVNVAKRLLEFGADVNRRSARGRTALHEAVIGKNKDVVQLLLDNAPDIDVNIRNPTSFNRSALMVAIRQNSCDIAQALLNHPGNLVDVDMQDSQGNTALSLSALMDLGDIVDTLFTLHARVDLTETSSGRSAMVIAAEKNRFGIVSSLLSHGTDPNLPKDVKARTPALAAAELGNIETLEILINNKFHKADLSCVDEDGRTLMHFAAEYGHVDILKLLKAHDLNVNSPCLHGMTPLHSACRMEQDDAAEFLVANGADCAAKDKFDRTPYMVAWQYGNEYLMDLLRDKGTNKEVDSAYNIQIERLPIWSLVTLCRLDLITESNIVKTGKLDFSAKEPITGNTALHCAIANCENRPGAPILQELLNADATYINEPNRGKKTPLHLAVMYECLDCTEILLKFKPKLDEVDRYGNTPLAIACNKDSFAIAISLVEAGASTRDTKFAMQKLLFAAIEFQSVKAVQNLMMAGADRMAQDEYGRTADILARQVDDGDGKILRILRSNRSFVYHAKPMKTAFTSEVSEIEEESDEEAAASIGYRPAFPRPAGLDDEKLCAA